MLDQEIGKGGEGVVYTVDNDPSQVAKIYHPSLRLAEQEEKLRTMIAFPPQCGHSSTHLAIAWPTALLYRHGKFSGYLMPRVRHGHSVFKIYNPQSRANVARFFDWRHLHRTAQNVASALHALHCSHYVVGDINQKNTMVATNALVTLIDTDSFQVSGAGGKIYRCRVGVPEYTPPELQGK